MSNVWQTSRCTALVTRQVKRHTYCFSNLRFRCLMLKGPKTSNRTFRKRYCLSSSANREQGRSAMRGVVFWGIRQMKLGQMKHLLLSCFKNCLSPIRMKCCCRFARTNSVLRCLHLLWACSFIDFVILFLLSRITGFFWL